MTVIGGQQSNDFLKNNVLLSSRSANMWVMKKNRRKGKKTRFFQYHTCVNPY